MKLEHRQMGLSEEQSQEYTQLRQQLENSLIRFKKQADPVLLGHDCRVCELVSRMLKSRAEFFLNHGSEAVVLKYRTYAELKSVLEDQVRDLEQVITDVSEAKTQIDAHEVVKTDSEIKVNMAAPSLKN